MKVNTVKLTEPTKWFVGSTDGSLYDTTRDNWSSNPVRVDYSRHYMTIDNGRQLRACLRAGAYAYGSYELGFYTSDGAVLSFDAVADNLYSVIDSIRSECNDGWRVVGLFNSADTDEPLICDHSGRAIG